MPFDFITDFYVIVITPLVMAALLVVIGAARVARDPEKRNDIAYVHGSLLLLLSFLVLPATSMKIFRLLAPCFKLTTNNTWLHYVSLRLDHDDFGTSRHTAVFSLFSLVQPPLRAACLLLFLQADLSINCKSTRFLNAHTLGVVMIFVYPLGIPISYAFLLFRFRRLINPLGCGDELGAMRERRQNTRPELRAIDFLYSCYRPGAWWFEVFDSVRRIAMTGLVRYVAKVRENIL